MKGSDPAKYYAGRIELMAQKYQCTICGYIYDPAKGDPDSGISPGTPFESLPDSWTCPQCGASRDDFKKID
ncbi:MAG TPA: rubredoxin [Methanothrix sp.]|nr:rubredoxin [Methanothrix sp.]HPC89237.1 rubredoxin [Methanothrix sp.]HQI68964.1 rubredoxin [Methanothrix sp.]HRS85931.1 rubredoxin [Methanothrix sp.]HRT16619.1 rubredoxin [Methanothrix sp.]